MNPNQDHPTRTGRSLTARLAILTTGLVAYAGFHAVFLGLISFLNDGPGPWRAAEAAGSSVLLALSVNLAFVLLFGLQHAVMARASFKTRWTRIVPEPIERSLFVIATVLCLGGALVFWQPIPGLAFQIQSEPLRLALFALQALGWAILVWSTFLIDHFELFGLRQVVCAFRETTLPVQRFRTPMLYRYSRHPMMVGMLMGFWSTPDMTWDRLTFAVGFSAYILIGVRLEERELVQNLGEEYRRYQQRVARFVPLPGGARRVAAVTSAAAVVLAVLLSAGSGHAHFAKGDPAREVRPALDGVDAEHLLAHGDELF